MDAGILLAASQEYLRRRYPSDCVHLTSFLDGERLGVLAWALQSQGVDSQVLSHSVHGTRADGREAIDVVQALACAGKLLAIDGGLGWESAVACRNREPTRLVGSVKLSGAPPEVFVSMCVPHDPSVHPLLPRQKSFHVLAQEELRFFMSCLLEVQTPAAQCKSTRVRL